MGEGVGDFERLLLLAILRLEENAYGASIIEDVESRTGREVSNGAVYVALRRLEEKGMLRSKVGDPTPARGGRAKRYYAIRRDGLAALRSARHEWEAMLQGLEAQLEPKS
ncbi:MAG: PadR family transcriptional regulator [Acidobacteria bacterium]|nr:PadR family transcriptional regulator [Acidobacteriota bacterium]